MAEADPQKTFNVHEAKTHFSRLIDRAHAGEEIIVAKAGVPYARLVPIASSPTVGRTPGRFKHLLRNVSYEDVMSPCFTEEELDEIENASIFPPKE
ncbi:type II toxin-antitoxin system Phd/YefM family antitoxin [uncultured Sphingomonas sp.]|uniref:type II toxin-antitoxin system Phd/YefM family antitoxin n=1 Tax=uncultured Sphingomonas sp. TaxID=158754 RepID=UPI0035C9CB46